MAKEQKRLGRGLSSMIAPDLLRDGPAALTVPARAPILDQVRGLPHVNRLMTIPVSAIHSNPMQPRKTFDESALAVLADSIRERGTLQPIVVRPQGEGYELVAGERRLRAARLAGVQELPAIVRSTGDAEMLELALIENIQRADLNAIERARAYRSLQETYGLSHDEIAKRMGEDRATVTNYIRLLSLPDQIAAMLAAGSISMGHARALLGCKDLKTQLYIAERISAHGWSVRRVESAIAEAAAAMSGPSESKEKTVRPAVKDIEDRMSAAVGARVRIQEGRRRHSGRIIIAYGGLDDFQRIAAMLGVGDDAL